MNTDESKENPGLFERFDALLSELPGSADGEELQSIRERLLRCLDPTLLPASPALGQKAVYALLNASSDAAFLLDAQGVILAANDELARRLGLDSASLIGRCCYDLIPQDVAARRKLWVEQVVATGKPFTEDDNRDGLLVKTGSIRYSTPGETLQPSRYTAVTSPKGKPPWKPWNTPGKAMRQFSTPPPTASSSTTGTPAR